MPIDKTFLVFLRTLTLVLIFGVLLVGATKGRGMCKASKAEAESSYTQGILQAVKGYSPTPGGASSLRQGLACFEVRSQDYNLAMRCRF